MWQATPESGVYRLGSGGPSDTDRYVVRRVFFTKPVPHAGKPEAAR